MSFCTLSNEIAIKKKKDRYYLNKFCENIDM